MNILQSFSYTFFTKVFAMAFLLLSRVLLTRTLTPSALGSFGNALNLTILFARWSTLGTVPATQFIAAKYPNARNEVLTITFASSLALGILGLSLVYFFNTQIVNEQLIHDSSAKAIFEKLILFLPVIILSMTLPIFLLGQGHFKGYTMSQIIPLAIQTILMGYAFIVAVPIKMVVAGQMAYWTLMAGISFFQTNFFSFHFAINFKITTEFISMALKMLPIVILQYGLARLAVLAGNHYLSASDLGHFILASNLSEALLILYTAGTPIIFNQALKSESRSSILIKAIRYANIVMIPALILMVAIGESIFIYLFGELYHKSWTLLILLSPGILTHGISTLSVNHLIATGKTVIVSYIYLAGILTFVVTCILLCPVYGVTGLCLSSVLSSMATALICISLILKDSDNKLISLLLPEKGDWNTLKSRLFRKYHRF